MRGQGGEVGGEREGEREGWRERERGWPCLASPGSQTVTNDVGWVDSVFLPMRLSHDGVRKTARTVYLGHCAFY